MGINSSIVTAGAALIPVLLFLLYKPLLRFLTPHGISGIPAYPDPAPLLGDLLRLTRVMEKENSFGAFIAQVARDLGPLAQVRFSFFRSMVVLTDYPSAEHLLTKQHAHLERSFVTAELFESLIPTGQIVIPTDDMWKHHRRLIGTSMTSKYLSLTTPRANEAVRDLIDLWRTKGMRANGRAWQADKDVESATMDAICGIAFGGNWGILKSFKLQLEGSSPQVGSVDEALFPVSPPEMLECIAYLLQRIPTDALLPKVTAFVTSLSPTWRRHQRNLSDYLDQKLVDARSRAKEMGAETATEMADNTLDLMVARELKGDDWMPNSEMKDELLQYLVAGTETSGTTLSWWVKYMTNHAEVQIKLRKHILDRLPDIRNRQPTFDEMNATTLPYLEAIVHESLRLSKTATIFLREVIEDVVVLGTHLSKGSHIVFSNAMGWEDSSNPIYASRSASKVASQNVGEHDAVKRNQEWDSLRADGAVRKVGFWAAGTGKDFVPERWLDGEGNFNPNAGPSMPFALGQRSCFGKNLALLEMRLFMCQLNQAFFFAPIAENQNSSGSYETITRHPRQCFIKPLPWDSIEAQTAGA